MDTTKIAKHKKHKIYLFVYIYIFKFTHHHGFVNGVSGLVRKDTCRQARHQFAHIEFSTAFHDIVVDQHILAIELHFVLEVAEETSNHGREMNHVSGLKFHKHCSE